MKFLCFGSNPSYVERLHKLDLLIRRQKTQHIKSKFEKNNAGRKILLLNGILAAMGILVIVAYVESFRTNGALVHFKIVKSIFTRYILDKSPRWLKLRSVHDLIVLSGKWGYLIFGFILCLSQVFLVLPLIRLSKYLADRNEKKNENTVGHLLVQQREILDEMIEKYKYFMVDDLVTKYDDSIRENQRKFKRFSDAQTETDPEELKNFFNMMLKQQGKIVNDIKRTKSIAVNCDIDKNNLSIVGQRIKSMANLLKQKDEEIAELRKKLESDDDKKDEEK